jgi:hypothetical protein
MSRQRQQIRVCDLPAPHDTLATAERDGDRQVVGSEFVLGHSFYSLE